MATKLRANHRLMRPQGDYADLMAGLSADPAAFADRNLSIWVYEWGTLLDWAEFSLETAQSRYHDLSILCWWNIKQPPPPGSYVIDFNSEELPPDGPTLYRLLSDQPTIKIKEGTVTLGKVVPNFEGLKLGSKKLWRAAAATAAANGEKDTWEASDFAKKFLATPKT